MRQTLRRFARLTAGYSLVALVGPLFTIFLTPLYTRALAPADYGVVEVAIALSAFVSAFVVFGMDQALSAHFFDGDATHQRRLVTTALVSVGGLGLLASLGLLVAALPLAQFLFEDPGRRYILYLLAINSITAPVYTVILAGLRLQMGVRRVNLLALAFLAATITSNVVMVLGLRFKATGVIAANVIANAFACGLGLVLASQSLRGSFSGPLARALIRTGVSLLPGTFSFLLLAGVDRILLTQFVSPADLGLYAIANKLASMLYVLLGPAWNAWWPMALEMAPQPDAPRQYARMSEYFVAGSMLLGLGLGLFAPEILGFFTRAAYVPAAPYALALMIYVGPLNFMAQFLFTGLYVRKRTHLVSLAYLLAAAVNITLNILLNPLIGVWGAVWATVWAGMVLLAIAYAAGQRALPVPYRWGRIAGLSAVYLGLVTAYLLWPALNTFSFKLGAGLLLAAAIPAVGIVSRQQIEIALQGLRYRMVHRA